MSIHQIINISKRIGIQIIRSKWTIPYLLIFPIFFIGLYWFGFSNSPVGTTQTFKLGVVNEDLGLSTEIQTILKNETLLNESLFTEYHSVNVIEKGFGYDLISLLSNLTYPNQENDSNIFEIIEFTNEMQLKSQIQTRDLDIALLIPQEFSNETLGFLNDYWKKTYDLYFHEYLQSSLGGSLVLPVNSTLNFRIWGEEGYLNFLLAQKTLEAIINQYFDFTTAFQGPGGSISIQLSDEYLIRIPSYSLFELSVPGLIAFGIIIQPSLISLFFCLEFRPNNRTFDRIQVSSSSALTYITGTLLIQVPVMVIQSLILFSSSIVMGFHPAGNLLIGYLISVSIFPFSAALTYFTTAFLSNEDVVGTILGFGAPFIGFMSGAFIEVPKIIILPNFIPTASGMARDFLIWDLIPLTHTVNALRQVLLYDFSLSLVFIDILIGILLSMLYFLVAIFLFAYFRFRRRK
ncbi:MAG: ABC transporter permease [Candidatus Hodarchaeales archaeon]|jgi:ABC-2 type transport system permease protein